jgi:hypothetical protein
MLADYAARPALGSNESPFRDGLQGGDKYMPGCGLLGEPMRLGLRLIAVCAAIPLGVATAAATAAARVNTTTKVYSAEEAGFQAGSLPGESAPWHFRYAQAQVTQPDVTSNTDKAAFPGGYGVSVRLSNGTESAVLGISTTPASGSYNAAFNLEARPDGHTLGSCADLNSPATPAGDTVEFSIYFDGTRLSWAVTDKTDSARSFSGSCTDPKAGDSFTQAQIGTEFGATPWSSSPPNAVSGHFRLAGFTSTVVTNRTGIRGSAGSAPWPVQNMILTSTGTAAGQVRASTPFTWGRYAAPPDTVARDGRNFTVWLPANPSYPTP